MKSLLSTLLLSAVAAPALSAQLGSPGFEAGPNVSIIPFRPNGPSPLVWLASNTDGERMKGTATQPAAEGEFYACVLQNPGANPGTTVGARSFGFTGFDRIYDKFPVVPLAMYTVTLQHASGNRFGYIGNTSLITVESVNNVSILKSVSTPTPGLFAWTELSFTFTTDATTTTAALTLSCMGQNACSALYDDIVIWAGASAYGTSSPGCHGPLPIGVQSVPQIGSTSFSISCTNASPSSPGLFLLGAAPMSAPFTKIPILGVILWVDIISAPSILIPVVSDPAGQTVLGLPIPARPGLVGQDVYTQFVWGGPTSPPPCPPLGLSASNALKITFQR